MNRKMTAKQIGDAGKHYAAAMLGFHGIAAAKTPDKGSDYDLIADTSAGQVTIQVNTFKEVASGWVAAFPRTVPLDFLALVMLKSDKRETWLIPADRVREHQRLPGSTSRDPLAWLTKSQLLGDLAGYRENWSLEQ